MSNPMKGVCSLNYIYFFKEWCFFQYLSGGDSFSMLRIEGESVSSDHATQQPASQSQVTSHPECTESRRTIDLR